MNDLTWTRAGDAWRMVGFGCCAEVRRMDSGSVFEVWDVAGARVIGARLMFADALRAATREVIRAESRPRRDEWLA